MSGRNWALAFLLLCLLFLTACAGFFVDPVLSSITVTPATPSIAIASTQQMVATGTYDDASTKTVTTSVAWSTSDASIASVSNSGLVKGISAGTATITAALGDVDGTTTVTITVENLSSIKVSPSSASITSGQTQSFTATGTLKDGSTVDLTDSVTWASSNSSAATVSGAGVATGATVTSAQTTSITATSGSITSNSATLTVAP